MKTAGAFLAEAGIVLETRDAPKTGIGRCVIPRKDIPFGNPEAGQALSWSANPQGRGFKLRGKNYLKDRKKYPSGDALFDVVEVLALRSDAQTLDMGDIIYGGDVGEVVHGCPTVYIANLMLPDYPPLNPVWWGKYDRVKLGPPRPGQHICVVARMAAETRAELERANGDVSKMSPDVALMARHFRANDGADADGLDAPPHAAPERHCTKMVCMVAAGQEELPWAVRVAIGQGNGKPFMVNKTGFFTRRPGKGYFEIGVNAHNFGPVATNGLRNCHNSSRADARHRRHSAGRIGGGAAGAPALRLPRGQAGSGERRRARERARGGGEARREGTRRQAVAQLGGLGDAE